MRKRVLVSGVVQGVGFRAYAHDEGVRLGLRGWVRNRRDGRVEALVEGDGEAVGAFVRWCHRGSPAARVRGVEAEDVASLDALPAFSIAPTV